MAGEIPPSRQLRRMRAGSSITSLSPRTVSVEGRSACRNSSDGYTSRFIPSGALSTMNASGSNDLTALMIKEDRKFFRFSKSIDMLPFLLGIGVPCSCFHSACGRGTLRVRARTREPREGLGYQQDFDGSRDLSRNMRSWWQMFRTAITTSFTKRTLGHSRHHLLPPCLLRKPGERPLVLHDPSSISENNESAMNPRQILGTVNRGSEQTLPSACNPLFLSPRAGRRAVPTSL